MAGNFDMSILAIDTSSDQSTVAIVGQNFSKELKHAGANEHGQVLPNLVQELIALSDEEITQVVVGMGPGPFTGLRVGIAFAQAFAYARAIPVIGLCSLDAIAYQMASDGASPDCDFYISTDARRRERFIAHYSAGKRVGAPMVRMAKLVEQIEAPHFGESSPSALALIGAWQSGNYELTHAPIYVRRPDAYPAPTGVKFRPMTEFDLVTVLSLEREIFVGEEPWSKDSFIAELRGSGRQYLVAERDGVVIGYSGAIVLGEVVDVTTVAVDQNFRRQGIARELVKRAIDWARNQKVAAMMLEVRIGNTGASNLYESLGFYPLNIRKDYYGAGIDAQVMRKDF
jgi:tRNA threonylcarbamoyl adenosine modification protein YeaZ/ribosomal-protein-alanine acetyltransferase